MLVALAVVAPHFRASRLQRVRDRLAFAIDAESVQPAFQLIETSLNSLIRVIITALAVVAPRSRASRLQRVCDRLTLAINAERVQSALQLIERGLNSLLAAIYAMTLRQLSPEGWSGPWPFDPHDPALDGELNNLFGMAPPTYLYQACDALLKMVKDELARHGIAAQPV